VEFVMFYANDRPHPARTLDELRGLTIGTSPGYLYSATSVTTLFTREPAPSHEANFGKLMLGRIDLLITDRRVSLPKDNGLRDKSPKPPVVSRQQQPSLCVARRGHGSAGATLWRRAQALQANGRPMPRRAPNTVESTQIHRPDPPLSSRKAARSDCSVILRPSRQAHARTLRTVKGTQPRYSAAFQPARAAGRARQTQQDRTGLRSLKRHSRQARLPLGQALTKTGLLMSFASLGLSEALVRAIEAAGYTEPTPVQQRAIPAVLQGRDLMVAAQTGTGKTGGFALPILERLFPNGHPDKSQRHGPRQPRVLVLTPTRELAAQVHDSFKVYARDLKFVSACIFGGVGMNPQVQAMSGGDVLVACPGRLLDLAGQGSVDLSHVEILVLDEADRMLDMGFVHDVKKVLARLPAKRQNLLFSATFSNDITDLAGKLLQPGTHRSHAAEHHGRAYRATRVPPAASHKRPLLAHLITQAPGNRCWCSPAPSTAPTAWPSTWTNTA
jgi:ABC-type amino acid transport substrate-binding protein